MCVDVLNVWRCPSTLAKAAYITLSGTFEFALATPLLYANSPQPNYVTSLNAQPPLLSRF